MPVGRKRGTHGCWPDRRPYRGNSIRRACRLHDLSVDSPRQAVRPDRGHRARVGEHAIPALDEGVTTVKQVNKSLEDVNRISAAASSTANNVGALTDLYGSFLGKPVIKIASFFYALKSTAQSFVAKKSTGRDSVEGSGQQESKAQ